MRVIDLLETAMKTGDMIVTDDIYYRNKSLRYCNDIFTFVWCDRKTGKFEKTDKNECGYDIAILCSQVLKEGWYLEPIKKDKIVGSVTIDGNGLKIQCIDGNTYTLEDLLTMAYGKK